MPSPSPHTLDPLTLDLWGFGFAHPPAPTLGSDVPEGLYQQSCVRRFSLVLDLLGVVVTTTTCAQSLAHPRPAVSTLCLHTSMGHGICTLLHAVLCMYVCALALYTLEDTPSLPHHEPC